MGENSGIQWTHHTFNPWIGCTKVSDGCKNCYAETFDKRVGGGVTDGVKRLRWGVGAPRTRTSPGNWSKPRAWNRAAAKAGERHRVFCASLADVFDPDVPREWRGDLFALIEKTPNLDWLLLTKRPEHFNDMAVNGCWPKNVWLGVTVENQEQADRRIPLLIKQEARVRFLSCEPLLEEVDLSKWLDEDQNGFVCRIDWIIVGGESGAKARPFEMNWARQILREVRNTGRGDPKFFMKQMGERSMETANVSQMVDYSGGGDLNEIIELSRTQPSPRGWTRCTVAGVPGSFLRRWPKFVDRHGGDPAEWPEDLRVREFPAGNHLRNE